MQYLDVIGIQIETLRQQRAQLLRTTDMLERVPQFDNTTPLVSVSRGVGFGPCRYKVRVVLGSHG